MEPMESEEENLINTPFKAIVGPEGQKKEFEIQTEIIQDEEEGLKKKICKIGYFNNLIQMFQDTQQNECEIETILPQTFQWVINYMDKHNWNPPTTPTPIKSGNLEENLCEIDYQLFKDFEIKDQNVTNPLHLKNIHVAADMLQIPQLTTAVAVTIATEFYFGTDLRSYEDLKTKHDIKEDLTIEEEARILKWYPNQINKSND